MPMQVILTQDVDNLGKAGELVSVRAGYGRNYLVPRGLAVSATVRNKNRLDHEKAAQTAADEEDLFLSRGVEETPPSDDDEDDFTAPGFEDVILAPEGEKE